MTATLAPELLTRLERLATARQVGTDALISEAIRAYSEREETKPRQRPRPAWGIEAIRANAVEFADEDAALADADPEHRSALLQAEDGA